MHLRVEADNPRTAPFHSLAQLFVICNANFRIAAQLFMRSGYVINAVPGLICHSFRRMPGLQRCFRCRVADVGIIISNDKPKVYLCVSAHFKPAYRHGLHGRHLRRIAAHNQRGFQPCVEMLGLFRLNGVKMRQLVFIQPLFCQCAGVLRNFAFGKLLPEFFIQHVDQNIVQRIIPHVDGRCI